MRIRDPAYWISDSNSEDLSDVEVCLSDPEEDAVIDINEYLMKFTNNK